MLDVTGRIRPPDGKRCVCCAGMSLAPVIEGDGHPVCIPCIEQGAHAAAHPEDLSVVEANLLTLMHGDVVGLEPTFAPPGYRWRWVSSWPRANEEWK